MRQIKLTNEYSSCLCTFYHNGKAEVMMIDDVQTKEAFRGKGHATNLITKALELAKELKIDSVELVVNKDNKTAQRLYERAGFERTDKYYYRLILNRWKT
jgi:ribosomal protein S18 acetylase RimI-like enzyme